MKTIKLKIQNGKNRDDTVNALANAGYKTWVEIKKGIACTDDYFVLFECPAAAVLDLPQAVDE